MVLSSKEDSDWVLREASMKLSSNEDSDCRSDKMRVEGIGVDSLCFCVRFILRWFEPVIGGSFPAKLWYSATGKLKDPSMLLADDRTLS